MLKASELHFRRRRGRAGAPALEEDIGTGDVTTAATVSEAASARALITQKAPGVIYGLKAAEIAFALLDPDARFERLVGEGDWREEGGPVMSVQARARALLSAERTALNFLAHLSGVATLAARATRAVEGTRRTCARHAQDDPGAARAGEGGGGRRRRSQPPRGAV